MNEKVVIFGGSGFLGSHVADALADEGYSVCIYDINESPYLRKDQTMIIGDILDDDKIAQAVKGARFVYNFAGIADLEESAKRPIDTVKHNILGNTLILEASRVAKVERFIFASSVYVYSASGSFYKVSKQANELMTETYYANYGLEYTILRYGSLYGPRANTVNGIYRFLSEAVNKKKIDYYGDGKEVREYIHAWDAAKASVHILTPKYINQSIILTGQQTLRGEELLTMVKEILPFEIEIKYHKPKESLHYNVTPYQFTPKMGNRMISTEFIDMGQGLLQLVEDIYKENKAATPSK